MFERYTIEAKKVIFESRLEAARTGRTSIEPLHLLLGIAAIDPRLLSKLSLQPAIVQKQIYRDLPLVGTPIDTRDTPFDPHANRSLSFAAEAAQLQRSRIISTGHLLIGMLQENGYAVGRYLGVSWFSFDRVPARLRSVCLRWPNTADTRQYSGTLMMR